MKLNSRWTLLAVALVVVGAAALAVGPGCSPKPVSVATGSGNKASENPWPKVDAQLRKDTSNATCRAVLSQLNSDLALNPEEQFQPAILSADAEAVLRREIPLTDAEVKELRPPAYSNLDPHYLAECLYLREVASSLDVAGLPPGKQAEQAFAWVCRQLVLNPWVNPVSRGKVEPLPPVPPVYALRRGSGSGLERAFVFVALLQQLGLDGCLIGSPEAADRGWLHSAEPEKFPKGPFWAVGVRIGSDIVLFEPWRGEPVPGTLAQVKAKPELLKPWIEDKAHPWDVALEQVKNATPFLTAPLNGLAPRMQRLEKELQSPRGPRLVVDPAALRTRFAAEAKLPETKFWNPTREPMTINEAFTATRLLNSFLPVSEGGAAPSEVIFSFYQRSSIPADILNMYFADQVLPEQLRAHMPPRLIEPFRDLLPDPRGGFDIGVPEAIKRLGDVAIGRFAQSFLMTPPPRELIQRGQFSEAIPPLVETRKGFQNGLDRLRSDKNRDAAIAKWCEKAKQVYTELGRARGNPNALAEAQAGVELFWRDERAVAGALVDLIVSESGLAEASYLLAQCMHEQAERTQTRYERLAADPNQKDATDRFRKEKLADDWAEAKGKWEQYVRHAAGQEKDFPGSMERAFPGRIAHATRLAERASRQSAAYPAPR